VEHTNEPFNVSQPSRQSMPGPAKGGGPLSLAHIPGGLLGLSFVQTVKGGRQGPADRMGEE